MTPSREHTSRQAAMVPVHHYSFFPLLLAPAFCAYTTATTISALLQKAFVICFIACLACLPSVSTQQTTTQALAILDAPQAGSTYHAGSSLSIAIDVSGNGKLSNAAAIPGSGLSTRFDSLEIYLVSSQADLNLTVSQGTGLLTQESGSTVKHVNYNVPTCVSTGVYNLTLYEGSTINGVSYFSITPVLLEIDNSNQSGDCKSMSNALQTQPQPSNPPPTNPWTGASQAGATLATTSISPSSTPDSNQANGAQTTSSPTTAGTTETLHKSVTASATDTVSVTSLTAAATGSASVSASASAPASAAASAATPTSIVSITAGQGVITVTVGPSGLSWPFTLTTAEASGTLDPGQTITKTIGGGPTTVTVVLVSERTDTLTTSTGGQLTTQTTTITSLSTTTAVMDSGPGDTAGFFPVNAGVRALPVASWVAALSGGFALILLRCI